MKRSRTIALTMSLLVAVSGLAAVTVAADSTPAVAAAGNPGIPSAPRTIFVEDFENGTADPVMIGAYQHVSVPGSYTGSTFWTSARNCNGFVLSGAAPGSSYTDPATPSTGTCPLVGDLAVLPPAIGEINGSGVGNHALSAYTLGDGTDNEIQVETPNIAVGQNRWYTASLNFAARNCGARSPVYNFYLVDAATGQETLIGGPINACNGPGTRQIGDNADIRGGTIQSTSSLLWTGSNSMRLRLRNAEGSGAGNDGAIDDLTLVEATPQLDKQFVPATGVRVGGVSTTRFTITNSSELSAKNGLSFTDAMPAGLQVAAGSVTANTCGGTVTAAPGSSTIALAGGAFAAGATSCVVDVATTATRTGVFRNGPANVTTNLLPPAEATLVVSEPRARDDAATTPHTTSVDIPVLSNDTAGDPAYPLDRTSVRFPTTGQPAGSTVGNGGRTLTVPGQGTYTADPTTGVVTFAPDPAFTGTATPAVYQVSDTNGASTTARITPTVGAPPTLRNDSATTPAGTPVDVPVLANDDPAAGTTIVPSSVEFPTTGQPSGATVAPGGKTLTVPGQGTYAVDPQGVVRFTPVDGFTGTATPVTYRAAQSDSPTNTATATLTVTVLPVPQAADDSSTGPIDTPQRGIPVLSNDTAPAGSTLDPSSVVFPTTGQPAGSTVTNGGKTVTVPNVGAYTANPNGTIDFVPVAGYTGTAPPVPYRVTASNGTTATARLTTTVTPLPIARDDTATTVENEPVTVPILDNDSPGGTSPLVPGSVVFPPTGQPTGATVSPDGKTLTVPDEGTYTVGPDGRVTFQPMPGFVDTTTPVTYRVTDQSGGTDTATLTVAVTPGVRIRDDRATTPSGTPVTIPVLSNDSPGTGSTLDPSTVGFPTAGQPTGSTVSPDGRTLTVPGEGVYTVGSDGSVRFAPDPGFSGRTTTPVVYTARDTAGRPGEARITVDVGPTPSARTDSTSTPPGTPVRIRPLDNDQPGPGRTFVRTTLRLTTDGQPRGTTLSPDGKRLTVPGVGVFQTDPDGTVLFTPDPDFRGTTPPVRYTVALDDGSVLSSTISVRVTGARLASTGVSVAGPLAAGAAAVILGLLLLASGRIRRRRA